MKRNKRESANYREIIKGSANEKEKEKGANGKRK